MGLASRIDGACCSIYLSISDEQSIPRLVLGNREFILAVKNGISQHAYLWFGRRAGDHSSEPAFPSGAALPNGLEVRGRGASWNDSTEL